MAISNQYKNTLDDLIDSLDPDSPDLAGLIDEKFRNALMSKGSSEDCSKGDCLNEDLPNRLSRLASKTKDSQVRQRRVFASRAGYGKSQSGEKDRWGNKINLVVRGSSNIKASVYHHLID